MSWPAISHPKQTLAQVQRNDASTASFQFRHRAANGRDALTRPLVTNAVKVRDKSNP